MKKLIYVAMVVAVLSGCVGVHTKLANQYRNQATAAMKTGSYLEAAQLFERSAEAEKNSPSPRLAALAPALSGAATAYKTIGQYDKALKYYEEALTIGRKLGHEGYVAKCLNNIGQVYKSWGQYDKAL
ncbi:MAG: tetratricopeptide repeat protein, partial [Chlorobium sp.]|nr:tetratricopeptide repeat protein [Chlorobium sp.]